MVKSGFIDEIIKYTTVDQVYQSLLKHGFDVTREEAADFFCDIHQKGDLAKEELGNVGQGQRKFD